MIENVSPTAHGRKPSSWPLSPREWRRPPHRPTAEGEHHIRSLVADRVKQATACSSVHAALQTHLDGALVRIAELYKGERLLGRETAVLIVSALRRALASARPPRLEAGARAFCADLGIHVGTAVASAALAIVLLVTPVLRRPGRYRWLAASGLVAILATCSIPINPVRGMALIVVASFSQAALAVVTAMSQAATLTLASVLAKHAEEVDIDL